MRRILSQPLMIDIMIHIETYNRHTRLLFATGIEHGIHNRQVLKYRPSVTSRLIFHHLIPSMIIKYQNISLDVTDG